MIVTAAIATVLRGPQTRSPSQPPGIASRYTIAE